MPVPLRLIVWGLLLALSVMVIEPVYGPRAEGLNVTLIVQNVCGASEAGDSRQLSLSEKGALGREMLVITRGALPEFVRRTGFVEVVPAARFPKGTLAGFNVADCACRCVAEPKTKKQTTANTSRRVKQPMFHLSSPAMSLIDAPGEIPLVLQSAKGGQNGSWE
jgi:hypothetical protein